MFHLISPLWIHFSVDHNTKTMSAKKKVDQDSDDDAEDSTDRETLDLTKEALNDKEFFNDIVTHTKMTKSEIRKILKDPQFSKKIDDCDIVYAMVYNRACRYKAMKDEKKSSKVKPKQSEKKKGSIMSRLKSVVSK